jgi:hypothetical protein
MSETIVAMHAVKLLTFQPMMKPVRMCCEQRWDGQKTFEIAAEELMVKLIQLKI